MKPGQLLFAPAPFRVENFTIKGAEQAARLAINQLRQTAGECAECGGSGRIVEDFDAYLLTDDVRANYRGHYLKRKTHAPRLELRPRAVMAVGRPCPGCLDIRRTIKTCEAAL